MAEYKCEVCGDVVEKTGVTIRYIEGKGAINDIQCEECGEYVSQDNVYVCDAGDHFCSERCRKDATALSGE